MMKFMTIIYSTVEGLAHTVGIVKAVTDQNTASIKILERQVGQIAGTLQTRAPGQFPSQTDRKSQEECKAIFLRSEGKLDRDPTQDTETKGTKVDQVEVIKSGEDTPLEEVEHTTVALTKECSAIIQHKLPPKLEDPESFTIPIHIGNSEFDKALCDLGASVNLMPLSIFRKFGLGEVQPTNITLQLADRSIIYKL